MPSVTAKQGLLQLPVLSKDVNRSSGIVRYPYKGNNWLCGPQRACHSISFQSFQSRIIARASHAGLTKSITPLPNIPFHPLQSRKPFDNATLLSSVLLSASSKVRCNATQTQTTIERKSSAGTASAPGKEKLPLLDDGGGSGFRGNGFTPYYRGDDSGGSGGGGGDGGYSLAGGFPWGDFWFFMFLFLLRFVMMNVMQEGHFSLKNKFGKKKSIRRFL